MKLQRQIERLLALRASEWHQVLENGSKTQRAEFVAWLKQSPLHVQEYLETVYTDQILNHLDAERLEDIETLLAQLAPSAVSPIERLASPAFQRRNPARWVIGIGIAAVVALCVLLAPFVMSRLESEQEYTTAYGEQRIIQLADSSVVTLNADSAIEVRLSQTHRDVELLHGEALFNVAHDPGHPFTVSTNTAIVEDVGTRFDVNELPSGTQVAVLEGRVKVMPLAHSGTATNAAGTESLSAGQEAQVTSSGTVERNARPNVMTAVAWRQRRLIFDDAPLEDMISEFNRYNQSFHLILEGVPPGTHHYTGIFDATDPDSLAELLSKEPDLVVERRAGEIVIRER